MGNISKWFEKLVTFTGVTMLGIVIISIISQVITRNIFSSALIWPEEVSQFSMILMVFIGACLVEKKDDHIKVDLIFSIFPNKRKIITAVGKLVTLIYTGLFLISQITFLPTTFSLTSVAAGIPFPVIHTVILISIFLWIIVLCVQLIPTIFKIKGGN